MIIGNTHSANNTVIKTKSIRNSNEPLVKTNTSVQIKCILNSRQSLN